MNCLDFRTKRLVFQTNRLVFQTGHFSMLYIIPRMNGVKRDHYRNQAVWYAEEWLAEAIPYTWGGDDPVGGFDCSGLITEILKSIGLLYESERHTAQTFWEKYKKHEVVKPYKGCLVFWFKGGKATHIGIMKDEFFIIHASGGGSSTKTWEDAVNQNAFIKIRELEMEIKQRKSAETVKYADPFKSIE